MDKRRALTETNERIAGVKRVLPRNESEANIAMEYMEYLEFVKKVLEKEIEKDE